MKKNSVKNNKGFTLIEVLITLGLIAIVAVVVSVVDINNFRGDSFRSEVSSIGTALQTARANSFNNINQKKHGVAFNPPGVTGYVIFEGDNYTNRDTTKDVVLSPSYVVNFSVTSPTEVVFSQLSGDANYNGDITLIDPQRGLDAVININNEGKIEW
jgi:prepilin-type N-terminal cleavage/methylation domain-containing protein